MQYFEVGREPFKRVKIVSIQPAGRFVLKGVYEIEREMMHRLSHQKPQGAKAKRKF